MPPRKPKYPFPLIHIEWKDAQTGHGWEHEEDLTIEIPIVITVGFLIKENEDGVLIASSVGTDRHSNARIVIPKGMIVSRKDL
jgi:hypothetical protein